MIKISLILTFVDSHSSTDKLARYGISKVEDMGALVMEFSRDHYKDLVEQASDLIQCVDSTGVFVFVNAAWKNALGYSSDDVRTMRLWDIINQNSILH